MVSESHLILIGLKWSLEKRREEAKLQIMLGCSGYPSTLQGNGSTEKLPMPSHARGKNQDEASTASYAT